MEMKKIGLSSLVGALSVFSTFTNAALLTYDNSGDLFLNPGSQTTYDFEVSSGFPVASVGFEYIGLFDNINFDATVYDTSISVSGDQSMAGATGTGSPANIDLTLGSDVFGVGFWGLDLTEDEYIVLNVTFSDSTSQSYNIALNGQARLTPIYFGLYSDDPTQTITNIMFSGTDSVGRLRAWSIDDLTVISAVPVPAAAWLFISGLAGLMVVSRRKT